MRNYLDRSPGRMIVRGFDVTEPWPQKLYISRTLYATDTLEARPLTVAGIIKGVGSNFVRMNYWRFMRKLVHLGFLATPEMCVISWRHFTLRVWRHQQWRRLKTVKRFAR